MAEREEGLNKMFEEIRLAERRPSEEALKQAVLHGIRKANTMKSQARCWHHISWFGAAAAAAAVFLLVFAAWEAVPYLAERHSQTKLAELPEYVQEIAEADRTIKDAVEHGLYQPIERQLENSGYNLDLDGMLADNKRVIIFFSTDNKLTSNQLIIANDKLQMLLPNVQQRAGSYGNVAYKSAEPPGKNAGYFVFDFYGEEEVPGDFILTGYIQEEESTGNLKPGRWFETAIHLDKSIFASLEKESVLQQTFRIGDKEFKLEKYAQTPLRTDVYVSELSSEIKSVDWFIDPLLYTRGTDQEHDVQYLYQRIGDDGKERVIYFEGSWYRKDEALQLQFGGMRYKLPPDFKMIVNTDEKRMVNNPDDRLILTGVKKQGSNLAITFRMKHGNSRYPEGYFEFVQSFTDGNGNIHYLQTKQTFREDADNSLQTVVLIEDKPYPQPLAFRLEDHMGTIVEDQVNFTLGK
ncbi:hypothetical protein [Paenibacillus jiagnxiensis]|uniref:hypothetical protein n=1 Tax=Paenibacillus jiagnxiensis TaxID=3228926 RepID=UPI0033B8D50E